MRRTPRCWRTGTLMSSSTCAAPCAMSRRSPVNGGVTRKSSRKRSIDRSSSWASIEPAPRTCTARGKSPSPTLSQRPHDLEALELYRGYRRVHDLRAMSFSNKYSPEVRERAVRMVLEHQRRHESQWVRIPVKVITDSGLNVISESGQSGHRSERSDAGVGL